MDEAGDGGGGWGSVEKGGGGWGRDSWEGLEEDGEKMGLRERNTGMKERIKGKIRSRCYVTISDVPYADLRGNEKRHGKSLAMKTRLLTKGLDATPPPEANARDHRPTLMPDAGPTPIPDANA